MPRDESTPTPEKVRVLVIPGTDPVGNWIATVISGHPEMALVGEVRDLGEVAASVQKLAPDVLLVDLSSGILARNHLLGQISAPMSGVAVIVVATGNELEQVRQAMLYGAQGFLIKPFGEADLLNSVRQAHELAARRRAELSRAAVPAKGPDVAPVRQAEVVAVYGPKGGVGCTTLAINLAVALHQTAQEGVILVDADLGFGDVDTALNLTPSTSIGTLLPRLESLDDDANLLTALPSHGSGIRVLPAPPHLDTADTIQPDQLRRLLLRLAGLGSGYVVVDTWSRLDDRTLAVLDSCEHLVVVTTPQVTALRNTHRFLEVIDLLGYERSGVLLVLNHCYHRSTVKRQDVERALGHPVAQVIQHDPGPVAVSLNRGVPLVEEHPNSTVAQGILELARLLIEREADREPLKAPSGRETTALSAEPFRGLIRRRKRE